MRLINLKNELLRVGVLTGKGTDVVEFNFKPRDLDIVWLTQGCAQSGRIPLHVARSACDLCR